MRHGFTSSNSDELCDYVALIRWYVAVDRGDARWISKCGLYITTHVRASLDGQPDTIAFIEKEFNFNLKAPFRMVVLLTKILKNYLAFRRGGCQGNHFKIGIVDNSLVKILVVDMQPSTK